MSYSTSWERCGGSDAPFADYVGITYSTLAHWIQKAKRNWTQKISVQASKPGEGAVDLSKSDGRWVEAMVEKNPKPQGLESSLRIYFTAGAALENPGKSHRSGVKIRHPVLDTGGATESEDCDFVAGRCECAETRKDAAEIDRLKVWQFGKPRCIIRSRASASVL
jgi:hypothetical protein